MCISEMGHLPSLVICLCTNPWVLQGVCARQRCVVNWSEAVNVLRVDVFKASNVGCRDGLRMLKTYVSIFQGEFTSINSS